MSTFDSPKYFFNTEQHHATFDQGSNTIILHNLRLALFITWWCLSKNNNKKIESSHLHTNLPLFHLCSQTEKHEVSPLYFQLKTCIW